MQNTNEEFDFDKWAKLAKEDPDAYESMRKKMIQEVINNTAPEVRRRMEGLQWQIDQIRSTSTNPMASCLRISQMMWDSLLGDDGLLENMQQLNNPKAVKVTKPKVSAQVIAIKNSENNDKDD